MPFMIRLKNLIKRIMWIKFLCKITLISNNNKNNKLN